MEICDDFDISRRTAAKFYCIFLNNLWNLWWGGWYFFIRFRNMFPMLVCTLLLCIELNQTMCLFLCFLLLTVFIYVCYLKLCLYADMPKASWYGVTESLKISSEEDNYESRDLMQSRSCLMINGGLLDSMFIYFI